MAGVAALGELIVAAANSAILLPDRSFDGTHRLASAASMSSPTGMPRTSAAPWRCRKSLPDFDTGIERERPILRVSG